MQTLTISKPDDFHLHLRDGAAMASIVNYSAAQFSRAIVMPNLKPAITTVDMALSYRKRILDSVDKKYNFDIFYHAFLRIVQYICFVVHYVILDLIVRFRMNFYIMKIFMV